MILHKLLGREVSIECDNGRIIQGLVHMYTSADDNEPEPESITVGNYEIFQADIKSIKIIR